MHSRIKNNQTGLVSILITMFLMLVVSLIVIGFAKLTRREQREALDRQLSTQAFYAAESGVNDAIKKLASVPVGTSIPDYNTDCSSFMNAGAPIFGGPALNNQLDGTTVQYTCLLVDPSPTSLAYTIADNQGTVVPMTAQSGAFGSINFAWEDSGIVGGRLTSNCPASVGSFPTLAAWTNCTARTLRIDVTPIGASVARNTLLANTKTIFLEPLKSGGVASQAIPGTSGTAIGVSCNTASTPMCNFTLTGLSGTSYTLRIRSIYGGNATQSLTIMPKSSTAAALPVTGAQAIIDATGKANDVLRRIQVHADISGLNPTGVPAFSIASHGSICKRYGVIPGQPLIVDLSGTGSVSDAATACAVQ